MVFKDLSDDEWALLAALVGEERAVGMGGRGRPRVEPRGVANAVLWILTTCQPWAKLPPGYPSGPTCRRRLAVWRSNGALGEMIRLLSQAGRAFPPGLQSALTAVANRAKTLPEDSDLSDDGCARVVWKSPESWQAVAETTNRGESLDPIACIAHQLAASLKRGPGDTVSNAEIPSDGQLTPMSLNQSPRGAEFVEERGYVICIGADRLPNGMYRAWAEVMKDHKRLERSGLIGPRFAVADVAKQHALQWAREWVDHQCRTVAVASAPATDFAIASSIIRTLSEPVAVSSASVGLRAQRETPQVPHHRCPEKAATRDVPDRFQSAQKLISDTQGEQRGSVQLISHRVSKRRLTGSSRWARKVRFCH